MQKQVGGAEKGQPQGVGRQHRSQAACVVRSARIAVGRLVGGRTRAGYANRRTSECAGKLLFIITAIYVTYIIC